MSMNDDREAALWNASAVDSLLCQWMSQWDGTIDGTHIQWMFLSCAGGWQCSQFVFVVSSGASICWCDVAGGGLMYTSPWWI